MNPKKPLIYKLRSMKYSTSLFKSMTYKLELYRL